MRFRTILLVSLCQFVTLKTLKKNRDVATRKQILNPKINFNRDVLTLYEKYSYENQRRFFWIIFFVIIYLSIFR